MKKLSGFLMVGLVSVVSAQSQIYTDHYLTTLTVPITDWNMTLDQYHYVDITQYSNPQLPWDFEPANIVSVDAVIHNDDNSKMFNFTGNFIASAARWGGAYHLLCNSSNRECQVHMDRGPLTPSRFTTNGDFRAMGHRGYIVIQYHSPYSGTNIPENAFVHWQELGTKNMLQCIDNASCISPSLLSPINAGTASGMNVSIRSDKEPTTIFSNFENFSHFTPNFNSYGKGGVLRLSASNLLLYMPSNMNQGSNYNSRFKNARYDASANRGYARFRFISNNYSAAGRQSFIVKSSYGQIGPWNFTDPAVANPAYTDRITLPVVNFISSPERIISVEAAVASDPIPGSGDYLHISNLRRGNDRGGNDLTTEGGKSQGEILADVSSGGGNVILEVNNPIDKRKYWNRSIDPSCSDFNPNCDHSKMRTHASRPNRGWVKIDYLAAKCGEGGNGFFTSAVNIGFSTTPTGDCNGYADVNGIKTHVLESKGLDIYGTSDQFRYVYKSGSGNMRFIGKIDQVENANYWSLGCLMIRTTTSPLSGNVAVCRIGAGPLTFQYRLTANPPNNSTTQNVINTYSANPWDMKWVMLVKNNSTITAYAAAKDDKWNPDPASPAWNLLGSVSNVIGSSYTYGLAASSYNSNNPATVGFLGVNATSF